MLLLTAKERFPHQPVGRNVIHYFYKEVRVKLRAQGGVDLRDSARTAGTLATVSVGLGAAALVAGGLLYFTAPSGDKPRAVLVPSAGPGTAGLTLVGRY